MTRKDYQLIAKAIKETTLYIKEQVDSEVEHSDNAFYAIGGIIGALTIALQKDNPKFDAVKFSKACRP